MAQDDNTNEERQEPRVPEGWIPWSGTDQDENGEDICWDGPVAPEWVAANHASVTRRSDRQGRPRRRVRRR